MIVGQYTGYRFIKMKACSKQIFGKRNMVLGRIIMVLDLSLKMAYFPFLTFLTLSYSLS
jgi:hypothetical protein